MLVAVVVSPDPALVRELQVLAYPSEHLVIYKIIDRYPAPHELIRLLNACDPDLVLLDISDWKKAGPAAAVIKMKFPDVVVVGAGRCRDAPVEDLYDAGVTRILAVPVGADQFYQTVESAVREKLAGVLPGLVAILPAKAGNGASLTALNLAGAIATRLGKKVLLMDWDLNSSVLASRIPGPIAGGLEAVLAHDSAASRTEWLYHVHQWDSLDVLGGGVSQRRRVLEWAEYFHLLPFVTEHYDWVIADLPEPPFEPLVDIAQQASHVFIVAEADRPSLELARQRFAFLQEEGVSALRIRLVINRRAPGGISMEEVSSFTELDIAAVLPADTEAVAKATWNRQLVGEDTGLGRAYTQFARRTLGLPDGTEDRDSWKSRLRLTSLFSHQPAR